MHERSAQVSRTHDGIPWLGFVVYPGFRRVKARKVVAATRRLRRRAREVRAGALPASSPGASIRGWINHVRYADSWGLRRRVPGKDR